MALEVDIKLGNSFEKQALATAAALDKLAISEATVNALAKKFGVTAKQVTTAQKNAATEQRSAEKKASDDQSKRSEKESAFRDKIKAGAAAWYLFKDAVGTATKSVGDLAKKILESSFNASQTKREASAMVGAFTGGRAPAFLAQLDKLAGNLGQTVDETRSQFVNFRESGINNDMSFKLIKARADMIALGLSAETADKQIAYITEGGPLLISAKLRDVQKHIVGVGGGATAAAYALTSVTAAQNRISSAASEVLADIWAKVGPDIGRAANRIADFAANLLKSAEGKKLIAELTNGMKDFAAAVNEKSIMSGLKTMLSVLESIASVARGLSAILSGKIGESVAQLIGAYEVNDKNAQALNAKRAELAGGAIGEGLAKGIADSADLATGQSDKMAEDVLNATAEKLQIHSPSKVFARFGRNTVEGFEQGQAQAIPEEMPLTQALRADAPQMAAVAAPGAPGRDGASGAPARSMGGGTITIQNLIVQGGGTAEENARSIRQELQLLLTAGNLSRGVASV